MASLRQNDDGYELRWAGDQGGALLLTLHQPAGGQRQLAVAARHLQLAPLLPWLALKSGLPAGLSQWLGNGHPHGESEAEVELTLRPYSKESASSFASSSEKPDIFTASSRIRNAAEG